jgi:hypothetical protein
MKSIKYISKMAELAYKLIELANYYSDVDADEIAFTRKNEGIDREYVEQVDLEYSIISIKVQEYKNDFARMPDADAVMELYRAKFRDPAVAKTLNQRYADLRSRWKATVDAFSDLISIKRNVVSILRVRTGNGLLPIAGYSSLSVVLDDVHNNVADYIDQLSQAYSDYTAFLSSTLGLREREGLSTGNPADRAHSLANGSAPGLATGAGEKASGASAVTGAKATGAPVVATGSDKKATEAPVVATGADKKSNGSVAAQGNLAADLAGSPTKSPSTNPADHPDVDSAPTAGAPLTAQSAAQVPNPAANPGSHSNSVSDSNQPASNTASFEQENGASASPARNGGIVTPFVDSSERKPVGGTLLKVVGAIVVLIGIAGFAGGFALFKWAAGSMFFYYYQIKDGFNFSMMESSADETGFADILPLFAVCVVMVVFGILGIRFSNRPERAKLLLIIGFLMVFLPIAGLVFSFASGFGVYLFYILLYIPGFVLAVLYTVGAGMNSKNPEPENPVADWGARRQ